MDPPERLPFPATEENRKALEDWIKDYFKSSAFSTCKRQIMPFTDGPPMKIHTRPDAVPYVVEAARAISHLTPCKIWAST